MGCSIPAVRDSQELAGKNRPADGSDGQVSVTELLFERQ